MAEKMTPKGLVVGLITEPEPRKEEKQESPPVELSLIHI